jgi:hypothetical protein
MSRRAARWSRLFVLALPAAVACGAVDGRVYSGDPAEATRVPDVEVLLVKHTDSLLTSVARFCADEQVNEVRRDAERKQLEQRAAAWKDSAAVIFGLEYQSPRWQRLMSAANATIDSSNQIPVANADPVSLADASAVQRTRTDSAGHYRLSKVRPGRYFVVPLVRESEFSAVQWYPVRVWFGTKRLDATGKDGWAGCYLPAMDSLAARRR